MRKYLSLIFCIIIGILLVPICLGYNKKNYPNEYYNVYLDSKFLGMIVSETDLLKYIDENAKKLINEKEIVKTFCENEKSLEDVLKENNLEQYIDEEKYYKDGKNNCIDITFKDGTEIEKVYKPVGLVIEKVLTYSNDVTSIEEIYSKITELKSFTVKGYQFTFKNEDKEMNIYVMDKDIVEAAIKEFIEIYVGKSDYELYLNDKQAKIDTVGSIYENIYIEEEITVKEKQIPIDNKIYVDYHELAQFLIFGNNPVTKTYTVKSGEMIADIAYANEISNEEFLISNPKYKNENSLIAAGTEVNIKQTNPQINVVIEKYVVEDKVVNYKTINQYDADKYVGYKEVIQTGSDGLQRIRQRLKIVNGNTVYIEPKGKEVLRDSVDKIIVIGEKTLPNVGDLNNWAWPSEPGWTTSSGWAWRIHPITGERHFHYGIDIAGTGYNSAIYAANNGTVITIATQYSFGNYIVIDHNNGYYTLYAHMNKFMKNLKVGDTVVRGQQIGYVGSTGYSTGPHIHFELWKDCQFCRISPWSIYR